MFTKQYHNLTKHVVQAINRNLISMRPSTSFVVGVKRVNIIK